MSCCLSRLLSSLLRFDVLLLTTEFYHRIFYLFRVKSFVVDYFNYGFISIDSFVFSVLSCFYDLEYFCIGSFRSICMYVCHLSVSISVWLSVCVLYVCMFLSICLPANLYVCLSVNMCLPSTITLLVKLRAAWDIRYRGLIVHRHYVLYLIII